MEYGCRAEVRDATGRVVFEGEGFNTRLHPRAAATWTATVTRISSSASTPAAGNRCCWEYHVISLSPTPRVIARLPNPGFETDRQGRTVIWTTVAFYDLGPSMAQSPTIEIAEQFRSGRLVDITSEYCQAMLAGTLRGQGDLSAELASLSEPKKAASKAAGAKPVFDVDETRVAAYTVAMQLAYCGRATDAAQLIRDVWPDTMEADVREERRHRSRSASARRQRVAIESLAIYQHYQITYKFPDSTLYGLKSRIFATVGPSSFCSTATSKSTI